MSKTILVTGGSRGIGRATCLLAAQRGWSVGVNYLKDSAAAQSAVAEVERSGGKAVAVAGDVSRESDVIAMFQATTTALGPLDGVVVNAGVAAPTSRLVDMSVERMRQVFDVNVLGAYLVAREAARSMNKSRGGAGGSIVLISSVAARIGAPDTYVDYAGSKAAVDALALGLSKELGREGCASTLFGRALSRLRFMLPMGSQRGPTRSAHPPHSAVRELQMKSRKPLSGS
jgi:NAD(P)-dependent dehydrogenase (short-subunit alcohol dehydrogenase family)